MAILKRNTEKGWVNPQLTGGTVFPPLVFLRCLLQTCHRQIFRTLLTINLTMTHPDRGKLASCDRLIVDAVRVT